MPTSQIMETSKYFDCCHTGVCCDSTFFAITTEYTDEITLVGFTFLQELSHGWSSCHK